METKIEPLFSIKEIQFGLLSAQTILNMAPLEITTLKIPLKQKLTSYKDNDIILDDERLGIIENDKLCPTCGKNNEHCIGGFGHIKLHIPVIHPSSACQKLIVNLLNCFCYSCNKLLISSDMLIPFNLYKKEGLDKLPFIVEKSMSINICPHCDKPQPKFYYTASEQKYYMLVSNSLAKATKKNSVEHVLDTREIYTLLQKISDQDIKTLGFDPNFFRPKDMVITVIPTLPICARPYIVSEGKKCPDDLTTLYSFILKNNQKIKEAMEKGTDYDDAYKRVRFFLNALMINTKNQAVQPNRRPMRSIKARLSGKGGLFRSNLCGKRGAYSGRTVVGGSPDLHINELGVPKCIYSALTFPQVVQNYNISFISSLIDKGEVNYIEYNGKRTTMEYATKTRPTKIEYGDRIFRDNKEIQYWTMTDFHSELRKGDKIVKANGSSVNYIPSLKKPFKLEIGMVAHCWLQNGTRVVINRQPT